MDVTFSLYHNVLGRTTPEPYSTVEVPSVAAVGPPSWKRHARIIGMRFVRAIFRELLICIHATCLPLCAWLRLPEAIVPENEQPTSVQPGTAGQHVVDRLLDERVALPIIITVRAESAVRKADQPYD